MLYTNRDIVPAPTTVVQNPAYDEYIERRAVSLCDDAEPHGDMTPCVPHRAEARRQVGELYKRQNDSADISACVL